MFVKENKHKRWRKSGEVKAGAFGDVAHEVATEDDFKVVVM